MEVTFIWPQQQASQARAPAFSFFLVFNLPVHGCTRQKKYCDHLEEAFDEKRTLFETAARLGCPKGGDIRVTTYLKDVRPWSGGISSHSGRHGGQHTFPLIYAILDENGKEYSIKRNITVSLPKHRCNDFLQCIALKDACMASKRREEYEYRAELEWTNPGHCLISATALWTMAMPSSYFS
jgi:hypothetical protein